MCLTVRFPFVQLAVITLDSIILLGRNDVEILYMMGMPYCWSSIVIGYFQGVQHLLKAVVAILGVPVLQLFVSDACMGMLGSVSGAASNLLMAVANTSFALWFGTARNSIILGGCPLNGPLSVMKYPTRESPRRDAAFPY